MLKVKFHLISVALSATALGWEPATVYQRQPQDDSDQPRRAEGERRDHHPNRRRRCVWMMERKKGSIRLDLMCK